jgi:hypothetical protein
MSEQNRVYGSEKENARSLEDEDSVRRSTKKKKDSHPTKGQEDGIGTGFCPPKGFKAGMSYRDSLLGEIPGAYEQAFVGSAMDNDVVSSDEEEVIPEDGEVVINIPRETKIRIRAPWSTSFIVKVFGQSVGYLFLVNRLKSLWKPAAGFSCVDLGLGFFLVKLELVDDFDRILKGGPWFIGEHFLSLRPWIPDFRPSEAAVNTVAVWVRLPELPVEYYDKESLLLIGQALGPVLRVDFNTASGARGRFARLCIQLDLDKPFVKTVRMGRVRQAVVYEGIGLLCFNCGRIGHKLDRCLERGGSSTTLVAPDTSSPTSPPASDDVPNSFGPWMMVTRRKRQIKPSNVLNAQREEMKTGTFSDAGSGAKKNKEIKSPRGSPKGKKLSDNIRAPLSGPSTSKNSGSGLNQQTSLKPKPSSIQS